MADHPDRCADSYAGFAANGRRYCPSDRPIVVVCIDGCADEYISASLTHGRVPNLQRMCRQGYRGLARTALPSFTNVNNACIAAGVSPSVTGISGNFFLDPDTGQEAMMTAPQHLRCETIFAAAAATGRTVAVVTAKEKLRNILACGLDPTGSIAFSAERADQAAQPTHGICDVEALVGRPTPPIYSEQASVFVLQAGAALIEQRQADFLFLSLTDFVQHTQGPDSPEALAFYEVIDVQLGRFWDAGAIVGITADHGMNPKMTPTGEPNILYLQSLLTQRFGTDIRVICPITDPYTVHHAGLGSAACVHLALASEVEPVGRWLLELEGITEVYDRATAARKLELPADRIGDLFVLAGRNVVIGRTPADHDLRLLKGVLRSHGGRYEEMVPLILSEPLNDAYVLRAAADPRNFDIFDLVCNGTRG